jgi:hypothetical protein
MQDKRLSHTGSVQKVDLRSEVADWKIGEPKSGQQGT